MWAGQRRFRGGIGLFGPGARSPGLTALDPYAPQEYREQKMAGTDFPIGRHEDVTGQSPIDVFQESG